MRLTRSVCVILLIAAAACSASLTAPPSGLPVTLSFDDTPREQVPSITRSGDSVTAIVASTGGPSCGGVPKTAAGLRGDELVVTLTQPEDRRPCPTALFAFAPYKVVVHDVPSSTSSAKVVLRLVSGDNATYSTLASGTIMVE